MGEIKVKLGVAPTRRDIFSREASIREKEKTLSRLEALKVDFASLEGICGDGLLSSPADVPKAAGHLRESGADALFIPHCNFGTEEAVSHLAAELALPVLLWGPRDGEPDGSGLRDRDTQCGLFATGKVLRRMRVPFTYLVNTRVDGPYFERGLGDFLGAVAAARGFLGARIGQVSTRPRPFMSMMVNEGELLERWRISLIPIAMTDLVGWVRKRLSGARKELEAVASDWKGRFKVEGVSEDDLLKLAALKVSLREWAGSEGLDAIAIQCWSALQDELDIVPCFVMGELAGEGLPVACETDVHGALSMLLVEGATLGGAPFLADFTVRHPTDDDAELIWHCGPFPGCLAAEGEKKLSGHYLLEGGCPAVGEFRMKDGPLTLARFDGDEGWYSLFVGQAQTAPGPEIRGTYLWAKVGNWPLWEEKLVTGCYAHHVAGVYGRVAARLYEACKYIPDVICDPAEPSAAEIKAHWRGEDLRRG